MDISKKTEGNKLTIAVSGRIDTVTAPELDRCITESVEGIDELVLDLKDLAYTSSAGLRTILKAQKTMNSKLGTMKVINVQQDVMDIFDMTGFTDILTIE